MTAPCIPQADPRASYFAHRAEIDGAIAGVLQGGSYVLGNEVREFEREFAAYLGSGYAIGVANGTDALIIALRAGGVGPGDAVITTAYTGVATVAAIDQIGATPILVDVTRASYTIDIASLERALPSVDRDAIKAIIPVHLYGHPAEMPQALAVARKHGWLVVEDCAHSTGALLRDRPTGAWGDIAAFSFHPTTNLGAIGDGGAVVTSNPRLAERARLLREFGWRERHVSQIAGFNSRLDELQGAILRVKLRHLVQSIARRRVIAARYASALSAAGIAGPGTVDGAEHAFNQFVIRHQNRDALRERLKAAGVETVVHHPMPIHLQPAYRGMIQQAGSLRESETASREVLSLPMFPEMTDEQVEFVGEAVRSNYLTK